jgi:hypothetical protein
MTMRRAFILLLLLFGLVLPPVGTAMSAAMAAPMEDCTGMSPDDCPCCDTKNTCPPQLCALKCFKAVSGWEQTPLLQQASAADWPHDPTWPLGLTIKPQPPPPRA